MTKPDPEKIDLEVPLEVHLGRLAREMAEIRKMLGGVLSYIHDAESEIPERIRRFMNYAHDAHDIKYMYEELGHPVPKYLLDELERLDDRYRQILREANAEGGAFNKVRREMAEDKDNRWDHTRQLEFKPSEKLIKEA